MILYINACVRKDSRTRLLAEYLLTKMDDDVTEVKVHDLEYPKMEESFIDLRNAAAGNDPEAECLALARQFVSADTIVVAAPYWDRASGHAATKKWKHSPKKRADTYRQRRSGENRK